jgi:hypothetical protein
MFTWLPGFAENIETRRFRRVSLRCHPDLNWGMTVLQTVALPLGDGTEGQIF